MIRNRDAAPGAQSSKHPTQFAAKKNGTHPESLGASTSSDQEIAKRLRSAAGTEVTDEMHEKVLGTNHRSITHAVASLERASLEAIEGAYERAWAHEDSMRLCALGDTIDHILGPNAATAPAYTILRNAGLEAYKRVLNAGEYSDRQMADRREIFSEFAAAYGAILAAQDADVAKFLPDSAKPRPEDLEALNSIFGPLNR